MSIKDALEARIRQAFLPERLHVENESHRHAVPEGSETHFSALIVAPAFEGQRLVERHRRVYAALREHLQGGVHALSLRTLTPTEWQAAGRVEGCDVPPCRGGSRAAPDAAG